MVRFECKYVETNMVDEIVLKKDRSERRDKKAYQDFEMLILIALKIQKFVYAIHI